jgi:hypothetical protein
MEIVMDSIYSWVNSLSAFHQSLLGAAVFSVSSWLLQKAYKKAKSGGSAFWAAYSEVDVLKHVLHKEYVRSGNMQYASYGTSIALLQAARWVMSGILTLVFFFGVNAIAKREWLFVAAAWFTFNCMLEARNWLKDSSDEKHISHVPEEIVAKISEALKPIEPVKVDEKNN